MQTDMDPMTLRLSTTALSPPSAPFDAEVFLHSSGLARRQAAFCSGAALYAQGDVADSVFYVQEGRVKHSVIARTGREAIVAMLGPGDFVGESALAGHLVRMGTATAVMPTRVLVVEKGEMLRVLHEQHALSDRFILHVLSRNARAEADLVDQLFNHSEKRLARALLFLARYGKPDGPHRVVPKPSQEALAEMIGTTRSRVNFFMNKFRKLKFVEYGSRDNDPKVNGALLTVVLHE